MQIRIDGRSDHQRAIFIASLYVPRNFRKRGIGRWLVNGARKQFASLPFYGYIRETRRDDALSAVSFWSKLGAVGSFEDLRCTGREIYLQEAPGQSRADFLLLPLNDAVTGERRRLMANELPTH